MVVIHYSESLECDGVDMNRRLANVDKESPIPIYYQVAGIIRDRIANGEWEINEKIPSESAFIEEYGISRVTLRKSLDVLEAEGIIKKEQGKGMFVQKNPQPILHDFSLPDTLGNRLQASGISFSPLLISSHVSEPIGPINRILQADESEPLAYIQRLFVLNDRPIGLNRSWLVNARVPGITENRLINNRLSLTLAEVYGLKPSRIENAIQSIIPDAADMKMLNIKYLTPCTQVTSTTYLSDGTPLEYSTTIWVGDLVKFNFTITRD